MSGTVKGPRCYRPRSQTRGAASNMPAPSTKGKGKGKGKAKAKGQGQDQDQDQDQGMSIDLGLDDVGAGASFNDKNDNISPTSMYPPSTSPGPSITPSSTSTPISAVSSGKRKHSALDDDDSVVSSSRGSSSRAQRLRPFDAVNDNLSIISTEIRRIASEGELRQKQRETQVHKQQDFVPPSQRRVQAVQLLQKQETYLKPECMVALLEMISNNTNAADLYLSMEREDYRKSWVVMQLKVAGFVEGDIEISE